MSKRKINKKGVALFMVLATILVVIILANVVLSIISTQGRLTHHEVSRIRAYYAAQAGLVYTLEMIRNGQWSPAAVGSGTIRYACHRACIDPGITVTPGYDIDVDRSDPDVDSDGNIPYNIQVTIYPYGYDYPSGVTVPDDIAPLASKADYTYVYVP